MEIEVCIIKDLAAEFAARERVTLFDESIMEVLFAP